MKRQWFAKMIALVMAAMMVLMASPAFAQRGPGKKKMEKRVKMRKGQLKAGRKGSKKASS